MRRVLTAFLGVLLCPFSALAADLTVISGGAVRPGLVAATTAFEGRTGHSVEITFNSTPQIRERLAAGEAFDVLIAPPGAMVDFLEAGKVAGEGVTIGRVGAGIVVREGAPVPDIATPDQLRQAVLAADSLVFNRASSGKYIEKLLTDMGIWATVESKTTRYPRSDDVLQHLLNGSGNELGFGPITRILGYKDRGLVLAGPLPAELQKLRAYQAAPMTAATNGNLAEAYLSFLVGAEGKPHFVAAGIE